MTLAWGQDWRGTWTDRQTDPPSERCLPFTAASPLITRGLLSTDHPPTFCSGPNKFPGSKLRFLCTAQRCCAWSLMPYPSHSLGVLRASFWIYQHHRCWTASPGPTVATYDTSEWIMEYRHTSVPLLVLCVLTTLAYGEWKLAWLVVFWVMFAQMLHIIGSH